ncbi:hypothetical protein QL093DRAFT_2108249 [Fusarium oxysporum]|nr:hypothetical protein QL093DRAFT_2108249 [Fusarium oxysporum]
MDNTKRANKIFTPKVLRPETDIYLTPAWDDFVPFPMTWKIRFDGFGESDYKDGSNPYGKVGSNMPLPACPPWYQPQGPSTKGGAFAGTVFVCAPEVHGEIKLDEDGKEIHEHNFPCVGGKKNKYAPMPA